MGYEQFFFPLDEVIDGKKTEFVACRLERELFLKLKAKAQQQNTDLSNMIRRFCRKGLEG